MRFAITALVFCVGALLSLGMVMLYSAMMVQAGARYLTSQMVWAFLGIIAASVAFFIDYQKLRKLALPLFVFATLLLIAVLIPGIGKNINGAQRWISKFGFTIQPSELAKIATIIFLSLYCERYSRQMGTFKRGVLIPAGILGVVLGLVFIEPDVGTTLLVAAVSSVILLLAGLRLLFFVPPVVAGLLAVGLFIWHDPVRSDRIYSWLNLEETKQGKGQQAYQARSALGAGGLTGLGLGNGRQKLGFVPEHHTDFIFSIVGEELGLIASMGVVLAFVIIIACGVFIATRAPDKFGFLIASGITFMIGIQAFINIGVVTGVLPNKGMPLPFISYGGSNLVTMLFSVGLLLNIARHGVAPAKLPRRSNPFTESATLQEV